MIRDNPFESLVDVEQEPNFELKQYFMRRDPEQIYVEFDANLKQKVDDDPSVCAKLASDIISN